MAFCATVPAALTHLVPSPIASFRAAWRHRHLIAQLTRREILGRYRGSWLGAGWAWLQPLALLGVYTFVFGTVFGARWPGVDLGDRGAFAAVLFCGMLAFGVFAECLQRAPGLVVSQPNLVKKVVFPLEVLPWVSLGSALFHAGAGLVVLLVHQALTRGSLPPTLLLLPMVVVPLAWLGLAVGWAVSALGVFVRDIGQSVGLVTTVLMFLSPVFYPISALPAPYRDWLWLNPLTALLEGVRQVVLWNELPGLVPVGGLWLCTALLAWLAHAFFEACRHGFADVM
jgi:lipopolysaccharide transport system permease protein